MIKGCLCSHRTSVAFLPSFWPQTRTRFFSEEDFRLHTNGELEVKFTATHTERIFFFFPSRCQHSGVEGRSPSWLSKKKIEGNRDGVSPLPVQWGRGNASLKSRTETPQGDRTLTAPAHRKRRQFHFATSSALFSPGTQKSRMS